MPDITQQSRLINSLRALAHRFDEAATGYQMADERHQARSHRRVAQEAQRAAVALGNALAAAKCPPSAARIATLADGRPAYEGRVGV